MPPAPAAVTRPGPTLCRSQHGARQALERDLAKNARGAAPDSGPSTGSHASSATPRTTTGPGDSRGRDLYWQRASRRLEDILMRATVVEHDNADGSVTIGCERQRPWTSTPARKLHYVIGSAHGVLSRGTVSALSPVGRALLGRRVGRASVRPAPPWPAQGTRATRDPSGTRPSKAAAESEARHLPIDDEGK